MNSIQLYVRYSVNATSLPAVLVGGVGEVVLDGLGGEGIATLDLPGGALELVIGVQVYVVQRCSCFPV